jgi:catechol 2,3-dioxygenase
MASISPETTIGKVTLTVRDLDLAERFYVGTIGLEAIEHGDSRAALGIGERTLVELVGDPAATPRPRRTTGLYHLAILVPDRLELARSLHRLIAARWRLVGASDHLVSEALYLEDPEGNGIEIYRDRPRDEWRRDGGEIAMATLPLDLDSILMELGPAAEPPSGGRVAEGTCIGHVHLHVSDLDAAERFYADSLAFDVTARGYPGALFMSAGGYHHHIGVNVWAGEGAPPPPAGSTGLRSFEVVVPGARDLEEAVGRLGEGGVAVERRDGLAMATDPAGNRVAIAAESLG